MFIYFYKKTVVSTDTEILKMHDTQQDAPHKECFI
jgi:hypothetical protein